MKIKISIVSLMLFAVLLSCSDSIKADKTPCKDPSVAIVGGRILLVSDCKTNEGKAEQLLNSNEECLFYEYLPELKILHLKHINTAFNCCPKKITADISIKDNQIVIDEHSEENACDCECLYDVDYELRGIKDIKYLITIKNPIAKKYNSQFFSKEINLVSETSGRICIDRNGYPWGN